MDNKMSDTEDSSQNINIDKSLSMRNEQNVNPNKTLVQQVFHKGLFNIGSKPRSNSLTDTSELVRMRNTEKSLDSRSLTGEHDMPTASDNSCEWQTVPILRQDKKRKRVSNSPPSESPNVQLTNRFSILPMSDVPIQSSTEKKEYKPPPVILYGITDINKLSNLIQTRITKDNYALRTVTKQQLRVTFTDLETYKVFMSLMREHKLIGHTFTPKSERAYRIVIRKLHPSTPTEEIRAAIEKTGNTVRGEIINARFGQNKIPTGTFFVNLEPSPNNGCVKQIKYIYNTSVVIEDPRKKSSIVQCKRCQQYGHSKNNCLRPYRCVKCAKSHNTIDCPIKDKNTPATCALCLENHPANYKGCSVYKEIRDRKHNSKNRFTRNTPHQKPTETTSSPQSETQLNTEDKTQNKPTYRTYSEATKQQPLPSSNDTEPSTQKDNYLQSIIIKQTEKIDQLITQLGTLLSLVTMLVGKIQH